MEPRLPPNWVLITSFITLLITGLPLASPRSAVAQGVITFLGGIINYNAMGVGLTDGFAVASTDTGHEGGDTAWMQMPDKVTDFAGRAMHETTVAGKAIKELRSLPQIVGERLLTCHKKQVGQLSAAGDIQPRQRSTGISSS